MPKLIFLSSKTYTHSQGLSCAFRQHKADSHCKYLHGYALEVKVTFEALELDERNWVVDFGGLKVLKDWLAANFDHKTIISQDDPLLTTFVELDNMGGCDLRIVSGVGCEMFCDQIYGFINDNIIPEYKERVILRSVEVREHAGNSAILMRVDD